MLRAAVPTLRHKYHVMSVLLTPRMNSVESMNSLVGMEPHKTESGARGHDRCSAGNRDAVNRGVGCVYGA
jgi:hypothetical protein